MALSHSPQIVRDGLVLYLDAANIKSYPGSGTVFYDLVKGITNTYPISNGPVFSNENKGIFTFDGINDNVVTRDLFTGQSINYFTVSFWAKFSQNGWVISPNSEGIDHYVSYILSTERIRIVVIPAQDSGSSSLYSTIGSVPPNTWVNITFSINNLDLKVYINGIINNNITAPLDYDAVWAGVWRWFSRSNGQFPTSGSLGNILIYNEILTSSQIKQNFNALRGRYGI
jgi:hypothetical protein